MKNIAVGYFLLLVFSRTINAQTPVIEAYLTIANGVGGSQQLHLGLGTGATDGIDVDYGETELPPTPPAGVFDARFIGDDISFSLGQGLTKDFRRGTGSTAGTRVHEIKYQVGSGTIISINWNLPVGITGRLQDMITGSIVDVAMSGTESFSVSNPSAISKLKITISYFPGGTTAAAFSFPVSVGDGTTGTQTLSLGVDPSATDGIDSPLGEIELPPAPPSGVFDARLVGDDIGISIGQGLVSDYRLGNVNTTGTRIHEIKYQTGTGTTIIIQWTLPVWATGQLQDIITGTLVNVPMSGTNSYTVTNPSGISKLKITVTYHPPLPVQLVDFRYAFNTSGLVELSWTTLSEINSYGFEVQKSTNSTDGYQMISELIPGQGTTTTPHTYSFIDQTNLAGQYYRLKQIDLDQAVHYSEPLQVVVSGIVETFPLSYCLEQNYPNPFNPSTNISYGLPTRSHVSLSVFNTLGQQVAVLAQGDEDAGLHEVKFDASNLASGVYFYRLETGEFVQTRKLLLVK